MQHDAIETFEHKGYTVKVYHDEEAENPLEFHDTVMVVEWTEYVIGNCEFATPKDFEQYREENDLVILPLYMISHSGISVSTGPFGCPWDSGQIGWVFMSAEDAKGYKGCGMDPENVLRETVKVLDQWVTGSVYGFSVTRECQCCGADKVVDSCWGFYAEDFDDLKDQIIEQADFPEPDPVTAI